MTKLLITLLIIALLSCAYVSEAKKVVTTGGDKRPFCTDKDPCRPTPKWTKKN
jgi:hypothetical protein